MLALLATTLVVNGVTAPPSEATHFRSSQLSWERHGPPGEVHFHYTGAWRRSYPWAFVRGSAPADVGDVVVGDRLSLGSAGSHTLHLNVIAVDEPNDIIIVEADVTRTYASSTPFAAYIDSCCRTSPSSGHVNNADHRYRVETRVHPHGPATGSPSSNLPPIVDCPVAALCQFFVPATSRDGNPLSFRLSTGTESGIVQPSIAGAAAAAIHPTTGVYSWDTTGAPTTHNGKAPLYSTQVMITETYPDGSQTNVPVDFFIRINPASNGNQAPVFEMPTPPDGHVIPARVGRQVTIPLQASDQNGTDTVSIGHNGLPPGATLTATDGNPATATLDWVPSAPGSYFVTFTARDQFGLGALQRSVFIDVSRDDPPVLTLPTNLVAEATGPGGAAVGYTATAHDDLDGPLTADCTPASGTTFALGVTTVDCAATDSGGQTTTGQFPIEVVDTTPPALSLTDVVAEATGPDGAIVHYTAEAHDLVDGPTPVACSPPSGWVFPLGTTVVHCQSADARGNLSDGTFNVVVEDTTAPVITTPVDLTVEANRLGGADVTYSADAADTVDGPVTPACAPPSGAFFALGTATVDCEASDRAGNRNAASFDVTVVDTTPPDLSVPVDVTTEAMGPGGTVVHYASSADDIASGPLPTTCTSPSGTEFPLGSTTVTCRADDGNGNASEASFVVTVVDTTAPLVRIDAPTPVEATSFDGAPVHFTADAIDTVDGALGAHCDHEPGVVLPIGTHLISCSAADAAGNAASLAVSVTVQDTTAPGLVLPASLLMEATSAAGAVVNFDATGEDIADPSVDVACSPGSGSTFPLGSTVVNCEAVDDAGNRTTGGFEVRVVDTTPPAFGALPAPVVNATSTNGSVVSWSAVSATDQVDADPSVVCSPPSGSTFPIGTSSVTCTATDDAGNSSQATFDVHVRGAAEQLASLIDRVNDLQANCSGGDDDDDDDGDDDDDDDGDDEGCDDDDLEDLMEPLEAARKAIAAGKTRSACRAMSEFLGEVRDAREDGLDAATADSLSADAKRIRATLGC